MTTVEALASWAYALKADAVPDAVKALARAQVFSTLGAAAASSSDSATRRILDGAERWAPTGEFPSPLPGRATDLATAAYLWSVASMALDFDDYVCFGHTSHSSVIVAALTEPDAEGATRLSAQIAAGEIEARLGGACLIGPLNGQLWSFIHAAGAAIAAGKVMGLSEKQLGHALAIALHQPPRPSVPGFMAPDSKLLTAADPIAIGIRAAQLAVGGVTGPLDVLDRSRGFFESFSYAPVKGLLGGLGEGWALRTLSVKPYPGCAYVDTTIDALLQMPEIDPDEVSAVEIRAGMLTCGMNALSERYAARAPTPVTINFSAPWNAAIAIVAGRVTPDEVNDDWLARNADRLDSLAHRTTIAHDVSCTGASANAFGHVLPIKRLVDDVGRVRLLMGLARARKDHPGVRPRPSEFRSLYRRIKTTDSRAMTFWDDAALQDFKMTFPAKVSVRMKNGRVHENEVAVPRGGAGHEQQGPSEVAQWKLAQFGPKLWTPERIERIARAIESDGSGLARLMAV